MVVDEKYIFDRQDADLFLAEDRDLKARAIRCSLIPRLLELANAAIAEAAELYGVEPLETATVAYSPYRVESRGGGFRYDCKSALAGLTPIRRKGAYPLLGKDRTIFPLNLRFLLDGRGLRVILYVDCTDDICKTRLFDFFQQHEREVMALMLSVRGEAHVTGAKHSVLHMFPCAVSEKAFETAGRCTAYLLSRQFQYPIDESASRLLKHHFMRMYPVFHDVCMVAMGREDEFDLKQAMITALDYSQKCFERNLTL